MQISPVATDSPRDTILRAKSAELEAAFLAEMLSYTGMDTQSTSFSGGHGEEQFTSFLRQEHAKAMTRQGGVGLAEHLFKALSQQASHAD